MIVERTLTSEVMYVSASQAIESSPQNSFKLSKAHSRSESLNSYGMFQPKGPNLFRSRITAWKRQIPKTILRQSVSRTRRIKIDIKLGAVALLKTYKTHLAHYAFKFDVTISLAADKTSKLDKATHSSE